MSDWQPSADRAALVLRARLNALIRAFFAERDVLEVETPLLSQHGTTDRHIDSFAVPAGEGRAPRWLRTSPEFALKRLLAAGVGDCYELGRVFRYGEAGRRHNPEFSMLEWYRVGWDHQRLMGEVAELVQTALALVGREVRPVRQSYRDLFRQQLQIDPWHAGVEQLQSVMDGFAIRAEGLEHGDWLDLIFSHRLQPGFAVDELRLIYDFPASHCALARLRREGECLVAERFEAFLGPVELANGYHELLDADEQAARFAADVDWRQRHARPGPPADALLLAALRSGLPSCAGVALGVDRLLAALLDGRDLPGVLAFDWHRA